MSVRRSTLSGNQSACRGEPGYAWGGATSIKMPYVSEKYQAIGELLLVRLATVQRHDEVGCYHRSCFCAACWRRAAGLVSLTGAEMLTFRLP